MDVETLAIIGAITGVIGALTGVASLGWQVVIQRRSGRLVDVSCAYAFTAYGPPGAQQFGDDQVAITVKNAGGAPVTITNYGVSMDGKENLFVLAQPGWATTLPFSVEPGGTPAELFVAVDDLRR